MTKFGAFGGVRQDMAYYKTKPAKRPTGGALPKDLKGELVFFLEGTLKERSLLVHRPLGSVFSTRENLEESP